MTPYEIFRLVVWALGLPVIAYLCLNAGRKMRAIRTLDAKLKEEEERNKRNPYAQMAELLEARDQPSREKQR